VVGEVVYQDRRSTRVDRDAALCELHQSLQGPLPRTRSSANGCRRRYCRMSAGSMTDISIPKPTCPTTVQVRGSSDAAARLQALHPPFGQSLEPAPNSRLRWAACSSIPTCRSSPAPNSQRADTSCGFTLPPISGKQAYWCRNRLSPGDVADDRRARHRGWRIRADEAARLSRHAPPVRAR